MTENKDFILKKNIVYIYDESLCAECDRIPPVTERGSIVHDLIKSYGLLEFMKITQSEIATEDDLKLCHASSYIEFLKTVNESDDLEKFEILENEFGLGYDCPILEKMLNHCKTIAGGSLTAAKQLINGSQIAINWFGGWHHAQREMAEGFCYINDIAIAIQKLTEKFKRILYIDFDIHHGNGVQYLFESSQRILTLSFHKFMPGFYPGSGSVEEMGFLNGKFYSLNVPLLEGVSDNSLIYVFNQIFPRVIEVFQPLAIVVQCGADGLKDDPLGQSNLTQVSFGECIKRILKKNLPTLFLGGGGYNFANTARLWTYLVSVITDKNISNDISDESDYFIKYSPDFELQIVPGQMKDTNSSEYLNEIVKTILCYCNEIQIK